MNGLGNDFLTGAGFARDQHSRIAVGGEPYRLLDLAHNRTNADEVIRVIPCCCGLRGLLGW
jgi:hypothetical protein